MIEPFENRVNLDIDGMGIVLFSAETMDYVLPGADFLSDEFNSPQQVSEHIKKGDITAFCTGSGGRFQLSFYNGYPDEEAQKEFPISIRLALDVRGGSVQFCDLFWLSQWDTEFPEDQVISMENGFYHLTVCTRKPESGRWGDQQPISIYFQKLDEMPALTWPGVPYLFTEE